MNVLVVGANGKIGQHLIGLLVGHPTHKPVAFVRKEEQVKAFEEKGVQARLGDLEESVSEIEKAMDGIDAVVFTAGSGGSTGYDKTLLIDLDGAVKTMEAAKNKGINRFIMISALNADNREKWSSIRPYNTAKFYADRELMRSGLDYTILRPGALIDDEGTGKIQVINDSETETGSIPRVDVAQTVVEILENTETYGKGYDIISGELPIEEIN